MRILHIAPFNTAGVPMTFVQAERKLGHDSRLVTLARGRQNREEDICLHLPFIDFWGTRLIKYFVTPKERRTVKYVANVPDTIPRRWKPGKWESLFISLRDSIWSRKIEKAIQRFGLLDYDVCQLDGGLGFYRDSRFIRHLKDHGKTIISCYTGSDLRTRGVIPEIDEMSDLTVTVEFDHLRFHQNIHHVPFPLDTSHLGNRTDTGNNKVRIGHAPTSRAAKGSNIIIPIVKRLKKIYPIELVLIEGFSYRRAIEMKRTCTVFIDQIGNLGYGMNGIEALAMGIPTCSSLAPGFSETYPDHPFVEVNSDNLKDVLIKLIQNPKLRKEKGEQGRSWVRQVHEPKSVVEKIHRLSGLA